jgi:hypothetical protein
MTAGTDTQTITLSVPPNVREYGTHMGWVVDSEQDVRDWHARMTEFGVEASVWFTPNEKDARHIICSYVELGAHVQVQARMGDS